ncbi:hypothetical protein [Sphingomonas bisphenolicum]|uniref:HNH endonuclease n=1 Tax=Sphingomonas bisphenolicum TaxID=296544 RepID=A0ABM7G6G5_9SPHN|nr:hypothetical protein [Sphingomonas bisphenolicum]BBF70224.1 hypothetical protein SBA_ch1_24240 [Sphingomonas bisphenolicum]
MTIITPQVWQCDRCNHETPPLPTRPQGWTHISVDIGMVKRSDVPTGVRGNEDLCPDCTQNFFDFHRAPWVAKSAPPASGRTDRELVDRGNALAQRIAREIFGLQTPDELRVYEMQDPRMKHAWNAATIAFEELLSTPLADALENVLADDPATAGEDEPT